MDRQVDGRTVQTNHTWTRTAYYREPTFESLQPHEAQERTPSPRHLSMDRAEHRRKVPSPISGQLSRWGESEALAPGGEATPARVTHPTQPFNPPCHGASVPIRDTRPPSADKPHLPPDRSRQTRHFLTRLSPSPTVPVRSPFPEKHRSSPCRDRFAFPRRFRPSQGRVPGQPEERIQTVSPRQFVSSEWCQKSVLSTSSRDHRGRGPGRWMFIES